MTTNFHQWDIASKTCKVCGGVYGKTTATCPGTSQGAQPEQPSQAPQPVQVPPDLQPLIKNEETVVTPADAAELRATMEAEAKEAEEVAQSVAKVDLQFPAIGFIDPVAELEKMRRAAEAMPEGDRREYPEKIRAKLLAHQANTQQNPAVTDEELALAIYLKRITDSPLTAEDVEAKATGKKPRTAKGEGKTKAASKKPNLDDLLGGL